MGNHCRRSGYGRRHQRDVPPAQPPFPGSVLPELNCGKRKYLALLRSRLCRVDPLDGTHLRNHDRTHPHGNVGLQPSGP